MFELLQYSHVYHFMTTALLMFVGIWNRLRLPENVHVVIVLQRYSHSLPPWGLRTVF